MKQVPEVAELGFDPVTRRLKRDGVPLQINPFDRRAVLEATRLREETAGSVSVVSMGPPQAADALRECLSLGIDRAVHLSDAAFAGADTLATSRALARAIARLGFDLVLAGRFTIDSETGQVGPEIAALLDVPLIGGVRRLSFTRDELDAEARWTARAECERDDGCVEVECATPLVITCTDRWKTRVPLVMPDEEAAQQRPLEVWTAADLGGSADDYGQPGSPTWVADLQPVASERRNERIVAVDGFDAAVAAVLAEIGAQRSAGGREQSGRRISHRRAASAAGAVWIVAEIAPDGRLRPVTAELAGAADALAAQLGVGVAALALTPDLGAATPVRDVDGLARELGALGVDVLLAPAVASSAEEHSARFLEAAIITHRPRIVLAPATGLGREIVPRVAGRLGLGLTGDAIGVELDADGRLRQLKPAFGGQLVAPILSRTQPEVVTLRPGVLEPLRPDADSGGSPARVQIVPFDAMPAGLVRTLAWTAELGDGPSLDDARLVVCVGWGLGKDAVPLASELASALGGVVGATRRVCDGSWLPRQLQIGISGRSVAPEVYLALGVRGSFNHVVGMQRAGRVVAVNRDANAEIFAAADLGIVGDARGFTEALLARVRSGS
ncbi:FAD-binding protein [Candidatus Binatia bacterium]|nr:FAD-binding protein [Candidatus Binatia bacterium]